MQPLRPVITLLATLLLSACAYQPELATPAIKLAALETTMSSSSLATSEQPLLDWWQQYGSAELIVLMEELQRNSLDLASARQRIDKARAVLGQQQANNWPTLDGQLTHRTNSDLDQGRTDHGNTLNFAAGYEVDLWGSRDAANFSAEMNLIAQQQEYRSLLLTLQAELVRQYVELLALRDRYELAGQNLQAARELLELIQARFQAGSASGIELGQQRDTFLAAQASQMELQRRLVSQHRALAILLGRDTVTTEELSLPFTDLSMPSVSLVQPANLLRYRPDIQLAESGFRIQEANLYQQRQQRWPRLTLGAGLSLDDVLHAGDGWTGSLLESLAMPLIDGGRIQQQIEGAEADLTLAELNYRQVVLLALQDTLETLTELAFQDELLSVREQELANNQQHYQLAKLRYDSGDTDFINLLTAQRSWFTARDSLIQARSTRLQASVNLFRAMGMAPE